MIPCSFTNLFFLLSIKSLSLKLGVAIVSEPTSSKPPGFNHCMLCRNGEGWWSCMYTDLVISCLPWIKVKSLHEEPHGHGINLIW